MVRAQGTPDIPCRGERQRRWNLPFRYFTGTGASPASDVQPDRLIRERTSVVVGDTEFVLIPVRGGETPDALMVYLPASGLLFAGDVMMPYLGVPFIAEGSPEGLLETLRYIRALAPQHLIQGHTSRSGPGAGDLSGSHPAGPHRPSRLAPVGQEASARRRETQAQRSADRASWQYGSPASPRTKSAIKGGLKDDHVHPVAAQNGQFGAG